ncbi:hypothetical protein LTR66_005790 [Elasticomyces elasticus]|nr:hypothetical protein LTR66_005790 [Elasticomyces elasticus]
MPGPGLLFVTSKIASPDLSLEAYHKWYNEIHVADFFKVDLTPLCLRYKNVDPEARWPFLALYKVDDVDKLASQAFKDLPMYSDVLPGDGYVWGCMDAGLRSYELIQRFKGQSSDKESGRAQRVVTVAMEPAEGGDEEFDEWYNKQHLDMLSMCRGYQQTTRYKLVTGLLEAEEKEPTPPRYMAIHEYGTTELPADQIKQVVSTEWSKKIIGEAKTFDRNVWELIEEFGSNDLRL